MRDYRELVSREPPEGLWAWAAGVDRSDPESTIGLDTCGLVYEKVWYQDTTLDGLIGDRVGKKIPMVRCTCSACGTAFDMNYSQDKALDGATYGFLVEGSCGFELASSGESMLCPVCGSPVKIKCRSRVRGDFCVPDAFLCDESWHMSASLLPGEPGKRPLVLTGWCLRRYCSKAGGDIHRILPVEAYVFHDRGCEMLRGTRKAYSGNAGYFTEFRRKWEQTERWRESWGADERIFGLTEELLEESCLHNAKLSEYLRGGLHGNSKFPVPYLRLYQEHQSVENLVVQGATYLLDELMEEQMRGHIWEHNSRGLMDLEDVDWSRARPSAMLGLDRTEFARMRENCWSASLLRLYVACKEAGELLDDSDITYAFQLGEVEELRDLAGQVSIGKTARYLMRQVELDGDKYLYDPDIDIYVDPEEFGNISVTLLADYWQMAGAAGMNLDDPAVRWPKDLLVAHDRAAEVKKVKELETYREMFRESWRRLRKYSFVWNGILIRPCRTVKELVREGEVLDHCVGSYAKSVAEGKKAIFFIRRLAEANKPWYTLELNEKELRVVQNRCEHNNERTEEIREFERTWLAWLHGGCKRDKHRNPIIPAKQKKGVKTA